MFKEPNYLSKDYKNPSKKVVLKIKEGSTPTLPTNPNGKFYKQAHKTESFPLDNELAEETRVEILSHYNIPKEHSITLDAPEKGIKRVMRAFTLFLKKNEEGIDNNKDLRFYADGHCPHAVLLEKILDKFGNKIGYTEIDDIFNDKNWEQKWETKKGFIDPDADGFSGFEEIRSALASQMIETQDNGLSKEDVIKFKQDPDSFNTDLPNWFRSG